MIVVTTPTGLIGHQVLQLLAAPPPASGELLVEAVDALRFAERDGTYAALFAARNGR